MRISDWSSDVCSSDLLVTHEMSFAHDFADRVLFFDRGRIVEDGTPDDIFSNPKEERTQAFLKKIIAAGQSVRSEERRAGKEGVRTSRYRGLPSHIKKKKAITIYIDQTTSTKYT